MVSRIAAAPCGGRKVSVMFRMPTSATGDGRYIECIFRQSLGGCGLGLMLFGDFPQGGEISWGHLGFIDGDEIEMEQEIRRLLDLDAEDD